MSSSEIDIIKIIEDQLCREEIHLDDHMANDPGAVSLDLYELAMAFEEHFDIEISDDRAGTIHTVRDAVEIVGALANGGL